MHEASIFRVGRCGPLDIAGDDGYAVGYLKPWTTAPLHSAGRGRHRRPSVSSRGARRRTDQTRPARAARHRRPRAALQRLVLQRTISTWCRARPCAAAIAIVAGAHRDHARLRHAGGAQSGAAAEARCRGRLRRLSDPAAADGRTAARRARHHPRRQRRARPRQPVSSRPRQRDRDLAARRARSRPGARRQGDHRRHADAAGDPRRRRGDHLRRPSRTGRCACWWSAAARARG